MDQRQHLIKETQTAGDKSGNKEGEREREDGGRKNVYVKENTETNASVYRH